MYMNKEMKLNFCFTLNFLFSLFPVISLCLLDILLYRLPIMSPEMIAHLNEWLEQCDTLQSNNIMTEDEII